MKIKKTFESFKNTISVIFTGDYDFQVLKIVNGTSDLAWEIANEMFGDNSTKIDHYDVMEFDNIDDANEWILEQVLDGRK